jgi:glycosyltransferase involved in cell wall biosynthesis
MTGVPGSTDVPRTPLVSLVMPAWNPEPSWLRDAVSAALTQVGCNIELIVVDDGSDVPVAEHLSAFDDPRLRLLRVTHGRVSRARNAALEVARGAYVRFVDCDDVIVPDSTAHLVRLAGAGAVIAYGATLVCDEQLRPFSTIESRLQGDASVSCLLNRFDTTIHSLLFPRHVVDEIGPWEPSIVVSQDWDYALRAFERFPVRGDTRVATFYRTHPGMNSRDIAEGIRGYRMVLDRYFERHPEAHGGELERRANAHYHLFAAAQEAGELGRYRASLRHLRRAFSLDAATTLKQLPRHGVMPLRPSGRQVRRATRTSRTHGG